MRTAVKLGLPVLLAAAVAACDENPPLTPPLDADLFHDGPSPFSPGSAVGLELIATGLTAPVGLTEAPDGTGRLFVVDQTGRIRIVLPGGALHPVPFLDVSGRMVSLSTGLDERGLLGLAFHPGYAGNGRFFVYYSAPLRPGAPAGFNHTSHVSEFTVTQDPNVADPASERILLQVDQPQANHNAGALHFGPDGFLYISLGDGGGANDVGTGHTPGLGNAQDITNLLGSILRIDVDGPQPYGIPSDNPFVGAAGRDEIFAYGLRNPYRFSFDAAGARRLFAADVGQHLWEEVNIIERGGNYGWNRKEGTHCFDPNAPQNPPDQCPNVGPHGEPLIGPIIEYANLRVLPEGLGVAVIGGYVYRGQLVPALAGRYVFGDWSTSFGAADGRLFTSAAPRGSGLWPIQEPTITNRPGGKLGHYLLGFGQDRVGEVYVLTTDNTGPTGQTGRVYRLARPPRG